MGKVMRVIRRTVNIVIGLQIRAVKRRIRLTKDDSARRSQSLNHHGIRIGDSPFERMMPDLTGQTGHLVRIFDRHRQSMKRTQRLPASHLLIRLSSLVECSLKSLCNHCIYRRVVLLNSVYIELCYFDG